jgi:uncharacterized membrane-anchored protein YhcB (DUF1043 family)
MQDNAMQAQTQPYLRLMQANIELLTRFWTSPEVASQLTASASSLYQRAGASAMALMHSGASANLLQGMIQNYIEFLAELSRSLLATFSEGQTVVLRQTQENTSNVVDAITANGRRVR